MLPRFSESIRCILGKHVKIIERRAVRLETKGDKTESRILVNTDSDLSLMVISRREDDMSCAILF